MDRTREGGGPTPGNTGIRDHWRRVEELYAQVSALDADERTQALAASQTSEPDVAAEVLSLLGAEPPGEQFLSTPWVSGRALPDELRPPAEKTIGPFRLIRPIGSGGMGTVYLAERHDAGFTQQVAIKVITATRWHPASLEQFKAERQLLATLHHPHIVTLIDGGLTDDGSAYLVMEYLDGLPITTWCRERRVELATRLRLFQQVCSALQYAHRHSVVHRDVKPANVLVTPDGVPKILDFGIARLLTESSDGGRTSDGWLPALTPNYASPEQMRGLPASTADDVYALGVLLFELLAGRVPYETAGRPFDEVLRTVMDRPPPRPSAALVPADAGARAADLRGDLDAIVLKAIDTDPARRYGSAQELADDLGRHLAGQAVVAREPSFAYVLATVTRRHRALVAASIVSMLAVVIALGVSIVQTRRAVAERDRADQRFGDVRRLANALIFDIHDAVQPLAGSTPVRQKIVAEALRYLEVLARDGGDDALRLELAQAYQRIGTVQGNPSGPNLGDREGAVASFEKAIALLVPAAERSREAALALVRVRFALVATLNALGRAEGAAAAARDAQLSAEDIIKRDPGDTEARRMLGSAHFWRATVAPHGTGPEQSIPLWMKAMEVFEALLADEPGNPDRQRNVALVAKYLGEQYRRAGDLDQAVAHHQRAREIDERRAAESPENRQAQLDLALDWSSLGGLYRERGQLPEAALTLEQSLAVRTQLAASDPNDDYTRGRLAHAHLMLGAVYADVGRLADGLEHLRQAVRLNESRPRDDIQRRLELADSLRYLAQIEHRAGKETPACTHYAEAARLLLPPSSSMAPDSLARQKAIEQTIADGLASCGPLATGRGRQE